MVIKLQVGFEEKINIYIYICVCVCVYSFSATFYADHIFLHMK